MYTHTYIYIHTYPLQLRHLEFPGHGPNRTLANLSSVDIDVRLVPSPYHPAHPIQKIE